jgi:peptide/nickel transport system permease protein
MLGFLASRLLQTVGILLGITLVTFLLAFLVPADPVRMIAGRSATPETVASIRRELGLDRPLAVQYARYLGRLAHGDMGRSYIQKTQVAELIASRLPATLTLMAGAILLELAIGLPAGLYAATRRGGVTDRLVMLSSFVGVSAPQFVVGLLLLYVFANLFGLFPLGGYGSARHVVLPALTLAVAGGGWYARMARSTLLDVLDQDYIRTAHAKGLAPLRVLVGHALRNALLPIIAMIGLDIGIFMSGAVVVESVYGWPGIGQLAWQAIQVVDIPIIMGVTLVAAVAIALGNLLADIAASVIDPRVRLAGAVSLGRRPALREARPS